MTAFDCPKCPGTLSRRTLVGVTVDQCEKCRGIFLDRGELEELLEAEHRWSRGHDASYTGGRHQRRDDDPFDDDHEYRDPTPYYGERRKRQASFLDEIFD
ncbi:zf-TFIIB domain-containing protein [Streptomonospora sp. S1-112]|uniref:Zf-TFIIB domain-containing protein n=1 Tax=Streptomonospora mangrovi TaxID=2883123 RepID=A0A9X3SIK5_9ACTN|nr:zf-TFIIB domain-containing protein [Streptomonospora mangrovi]MDA0566384.1 zf-TFIIB domain-containing protein [Streptomonospora mangrovi]